MTRILVWDWPVRLGHWLLAGGFALAWLTAERESLRLVHIAAGGTVLAVAAFRLLWGILGTRHARFAAFLRGPAAVRVRYRNAAAECELILGDASRVNLDEGLLKELHGWLTPANVEIVYQ